jgi:hypothetical protein
MCCWVQSKLHVNCLVTQPAPNPAIDLKAAPVTAHSPSCMILHVMMHLPKFLVTRLLPVSPALEEIGTLRHLPTVKA